MKLSVCFLEFLRYSLSSKSPSLQFLDLILIARNNYIYFSLELLNLSVLRCNLLFLLIHGLDPLPNRLLLNHHLLLQLSYCLVFLVKLLLQILELIKAGLQMTQLS